MPSQFPDLSPGQLPQHEIIDPKLMALRGTSNLSQGNHTCQAAWWARATPLKNMTSSVGMISNPIYGKIKNVPNHQPARVASEKSAFFTALEEEKLQVFQASTSLWRLWLCCGQLFGSVVAPSIYWVRAEGRPWQVKCGCSYLAWVKKLVSW